MISHVKLWYHIAENLHLGHFFEKFCGGVVLIYLYMTLKWPHGWGRACGGKRGEVCPAQGERPATAEHEDPQPALRLPLFSLCALRDCLSQPGLLEQITPDFS